MIDLLGAIGHAGHLQPAEFGDRLVRSGACPYRVVGQVVAVHREGNPLY
jgi:hypothetical protein